MRINANAGRLVGGLLLAQLVGLMLPFILIARPIATGDFMAEAGPSSAAIRAAVMVFFAQSLVTIGIAIAAFPVLRRFGYGGALWLLSMSVIWFCVQAMDSAHILSMMTLSERFNAAGGASGDVYGLLAAMLRSTRRYVHFSELLVVDVWMAVLFGSLFRYALVPRWLAGSCLIVVLVHAAAITLPGFLGYSPVMWLGVSMIFVYLAMGGWLAVKGFADGAATGGEVMSVNASASPA